MGQEHLAVSTGERVDEGFFHKKMYGRFATREAKQSGRDNEGFFFTRKCMAVLPLGRPNKVAVITR